MVTKKNEIKHDLAMHRARWCIQMKAQLSCLGVFEVNKFVGQALWNSTEPHGCCVSVSGMFFSQSLNHFRQNKSGFS